MNVSKGAVLIAALLLTQFHAARLPAGEVYKSVDANGHVVYSDHADPAAQKLEVRVDPPQAAEVARLVKEQKILKAEETERNRRQATLDRNKAQQEHDQQLRCERARSHYYNLKDARRVFERDNDGNRVYLSDKEADAQRAQARQAMLTECGS
jgi:hypothetical protein